MWNRQHRPQRLPHFGETENAIDARCGVVNRHPNDRVCFLDDHPGLFGRFIRRERCFGLAVNLEAELPDLRSPVLRERFRGLALPDPAPWSCSQSLYAKPLRGFPPAVWQMMGGGRKVKPYSVR